MKKSHKATEEERTHISQTIAKHNKLSEKEEKEYKDKTPNLHSSKDMEASEAAITDSLENGVMFYTHEVIIDGVNLESIVPYFPDKTNQQVAIVTRASYLAKGNSDDNEFYDLAYRIVDYFRDLRDLSQLVRAEMERIARCIDNEGFDVIRDRYRQTRTIEKAMFSKYKAAATGEQEAKPTANTSTKVMSMF